MPAVRFPFNKLSFMTFNTTAQFRNTFWSQSQLVDLVNGVEVPRPAVRLDAPITRRFMELSADVNGPTLVRIWDAPKSSYAQRFRHSIIPFAQVLYRTSIDNYNAIPKVESADSIVGSATSYSYGVNTRFYAKRTVDGPRAIPREVISASIKQTYNTDARSVLSDADQRSRNNDPDVAFHTRAGAGPHLAVRWRHRHVQNRLRRTIQPRQKLERRRPGGNAKPCRIWPAGATCGSARGPWDRMWRGRRTTSTPSRICASCTIDTASRTRSTGT